ncbi:MAG: hypothetical protein AAF800_02035 [Planctomycetota bacterium]
MRSSATSFTIIRRAVFVLLIGSIALQALGQARLDPSFQTNPNFWSPEQRAAATGFVEEQIAALGSDDEARISTGRENLIAQLGGGATERFVNQYAELVATQTAPLVGAEKLKTRVNAMLVLANMPHLDALPPALRGLDDPSAGVRYPAVLAVGEHLRSGRLVGLQRDEALTELARRVVDEDEVYIVKPMFDAMLGVEGAIPAVLDALNARLAWHVDRPTAPYFPERDTIQDVTSRLLVSSQRRNDDVRQLARVGYRYLRLAAAQLAEGRVPEGRAKEHVDLVRVAASSLAFTHGDLDANRVAPGAPIEALERGNWDAVIGVADDWLDILKQPPFDFTDADLQVGESAPQAAGN